MSSFQYFIVFFNLRSQQIFILRKELNYDWEAILSSVIRVGQTTPQLQENSLKWVRRAGKNREFIGIRNIMALKQKKEKKNNWDV